MKTTPLAIQPDKCNGCGLCLLECPKGAIKQFAGKKLVIEPGCVGCRVCVQVCPKDAIVEDCINPEAVKCDNCPVHCMVDPVDVGACHRYRNVNGQMERVVPLHTFDRSTIRIDPITNLPTLPLITGHGAGTNRRLAPARIIAEDRVDGVDVVTAVTEAILSFSGMRLKIDMNEHIGEEGNAVMRDRRTVGYVTSSEYGSRSVSIGGVGLVKSPSGYATCRTMTELANGNWVDLEVKKGSKMRLAVGQKPIIDGKTVDRTSIGCGSSVGKLFSHKLIELVDDCILLDPGITGQMAYHHAADPRVKPTGIKVAGKLSTPGRYMVAHGNGWAGTFVTSPEEAIESINKSVAWPGLKILVTDTMINNAAYLVLDDNLVPQKKPFPAELENMLGFMRGYCEQSKVNALYVGGLGGGVRGALHKSHNPEIVKAVRDGRIKLTAGGQPTFIMPGGNLVFMVDVENMPRGCFAWVPTPATVVPIEFSMTRETFDEVCGYPEAVKPLEQVLKEFKHKII